MSKLTSQLAVAVALLAYVTAAALIWHTFHAAHFAELFFWPAITLLLAVVFAVSRVTRPSLLKSWSCLLAAAGQLLLSIGGAWMETRGLLPHIVLVAVLESLHGVIWVVVFGSLMLPAVELLHGRIFPNVRRLYILVAIVGLVGYYTLLAVIWFWQQWCITR